jgi:hypothetical protein
VFFETLLTQCIDQKYNLSVKDHAKRCPLHRAVMICNDAAVVRLVSDSPSLVVEQDKLGATPLHWVVYGILRCQPWQLAERKATYKMIIEKLLSTQYDDNIKDRFKKSAWYYISAAMDTFGSDFQWVYDLRESRNLLNGARAAQPEVIKDADITPAQAEACRTVSATLAQFYISNDDTSDYLEFQRPDVEALVYQLNYGIDKLFERNLRHDDDKRATCRWVHLPANNVSGPCRKVESRSSGDCHKPRGQIS